MQVLLPYFILIKKLRKGKPSKISPESVSKIIEDYPNKILAEVTAEQHQNLQNQGYDIKDLRSKTKICVGKIAIDPKIQEERAKAISSVEEKAPETEYYFIQYIGPIKPEWIEELKKANITPLSYYHNFSYLVHGKKENMKKIEKKVYVRAIMPYGVQFRMSLETKVQVEESVELSGEFWILVFTYNAPQDTIQKLKDIGAKILNEEKTHTFYQKIHVSVKISFIKDIVKIPGIYSIEVFHPEVNEDEVADEIVAGNYNEDNEIDTPPADTHPYLEWLEENRVDGTNVTIGIVEPSSSGRFDEDHPAFTGRVNTLSTMTKAHHATMVAGQAAGDYRVDEDSNEVVDSNGFYYGVGIAPIANLLNQTTSGANTNCQDTVTNAGPNGENGSVQTNSWGSGTAESMDYQSSERLYDELVRDSNPDTSGNTPLVICFSAGNSGSNGLTRPKAAKNVIVTGNFENYRPDLGGIADNINERWNTSSIGNCNDGRIKPDIVVPGHRTASASFNFNNSLSSIYINDILAYGGGTSAASPKVAGACALLIQWWRQRHTFDTTQITPSPALLKAMLINGAVDTGEGSPIPNNEQGWGRVNLNNVFNPQVPAIYADQNIILEPTSVDSEFDIEPIDTTKPLKISLIWTDVPGNVGSGTAGNPALVNELGLQVTQGTNTWFGNNFANGFSQTGGQQDAIQTANPGAIVNNVQNIFIENPTNTTPYHVRISPEDINGDCLNPDTPYENAANFRQDFALVIQNARLTTSEPMDVMLAIDRSSRIAAAKASAQEFFDLIPTGANHRAGLVSYGVPCNLPFNTALDNKATVNVDMDEVDDALKTSAQTSIAAITASGCTSIGAGLTKSMERIVANGVPIHRKVIVLLSDGKENRPPNVSEVLPLLRKEYKVHAVGLGGSINGALMQQIANDTHGEFFHTLNSNEVTPIYEQIFALESDEEVVEQEDGSFGSEESEESAQAKKIPITNSDSQATFIVSWKNSSFSLEVNLITPGGKTITPNDAKRNRKVRYVKRSTHVIYTIQREKHTSDWEGEWSIKVNRSKDSAKTNEAYNVSLLVKSSLKLKMFWNKAGYFTKDLVKVNVNVIDKQFVLKRGVKMTTRIMAPKNGFGNMVSKITKKGIFRTDDVSKEPLDASLDTISEDEWKSLYRENEESDEIIFETTSEDLSTSLVGSPSANLFTTNIAKMRKVFSPLNDGTYTYRFKIEGHTASGARYSRIRTISKFIGAKADAKKSHIVLQPIKPKIVRLIFTPKDVNGNLIGPSYAKNIAIKTENGRLIGDVIDKEDGSYAVELEAMEEAEIMSIKVIMDDVSIPVPRIALPTIPIRPVSVSGETIEGKVGQLQYDDKGNFLGFTLKTKDDFVEFDSISSRLAKVLTESMEKNLTIVITRDESSGEISKVDVETS